MREFGSCDTIAACDRPDPVPGVVLLGGTVCLRELPSVFLEKGTLPLAERLRTSQAPCDPSGDESGRVACTLFLVLGICQLRKLVVLVEPRVFCYPLALAQT